MCKYLKYVIFIINLIVMNGDTICENQLTCSDCISYENDVCAWCSAENHGGPRCAPSGNLTSWCKTSVYDPKTFVAESQNNFSSDVGLTPQKITIKIRPGVRVAFNFFYKHEEDYPLDVYYLMDTSYTMKKHKKVLMDQSQMLQDSLSKFTNNVKFGVGSFIEKPGMPYVMPVNKAYSFMNDLSLTNDTELFRKTIENKGYGSNWDDPEAGLDALMQVMVCSELVGWRNDSRRMIVLCTDNIYHGAGDGKMIGAIKRNDMKCHMVNNNHTEALTMDYPSIGQINKVAKDESIKIIFAATKNMEKVYKSLENKIYGSVYHVLGDEANNIVEYIKNNYVDSAQNLRLDTSNVPDYIQLKLNPPCNQDNSGGCETRHRERKEINGKLLVKYCPHDKRTSDSVEINLKGLKEKIIIELELHCICECEKESNTVKNSTKCKRNGSFQCGICKCNENSYGDTCDCDGTSAAKDADKCRAEKDTVLCSGRGICKCGQCINCGTRYSGAFCELDNESCPHVRGVMCAGRGRCRGGTCVCHNQQEWTGLDCDCSLDTRTCVPPQSKKICSGNGKCVCGKCVCNNSTSTDMYCDSCEGCTQKRCQEINNYAFCAYNGTCNTSDTNVIFVNDTEMDFTVWELAKWCRAPLEDRCTLVYKYQYDRNTKKLLLILQKQKVCTLPLNLWVPLGSTIGLVLLIGLLTAIVWKVLIDLHDAREYRRFEAENNAGDWNNSDNPLYHPPGTTFHNPAFKGNK